MSGGEGGMMDEGTRIISSSTQVMSLTPQCNNNHHRHPSTRTYAPSHQVLVCTSTFSKQVFLFPVCHHFSRGVYAIVGVMSPEAFDTFHAYANQFQMPFLTPWFPEKVRVYSRD